MTTSWPPLSRAKCQQLREAGLLKLLVQSLHEHTFENPRQPRKYPDEEPMENIDSFLFDFNRNSDRRRQLFHQIENIIQNTMKDACELEIFDLLRYVRAHTERLHRVISDAKVGQPPSPFLAGSPFKQLAGLIELTRDNKNCKIVDLLGGVLDLLDHLRALERFKVRFPKVKFCYPKNYVGPIDLVEGTLTILHNCISQPDTSHLKVFLANRRSLIEYLFIAMRCYYQQNNPANVKLCCSIFAELNDIDVAVYSKPSGIETWIMWIMNIVMNSVVEEEPSTIIHPLAALERMLKNDFNNVLTFESLRPLLPDYHKSLDVLIDFLVPGKHRFAENTECHPMIVETVVKMLENITRVSLEWDRAGARLLDYFESHNVCCILVNYLNYLAPQNRASARNVMNTLELILSNSSDLLSEFLATPGAIQIIRELNL